ncbi:hypothetical protein PUN28_010485 [Cardiocondyla obscurior]|uniref:Uncharacterized protein n=1 Tax=Cardiocondyla obscurior TaxID=286306 RepID=A0AAW2FLB2_9HYME
MDNILDDSKFLLAMMQWFGLIILWKLKRNERRRYWVHPINENRPVYDLTMFFHYTQMNVDTFYKLLDMVYLATGDQILSIALTYQIGESMTYNVILKTTEIIINVLLLIYLKNI